MAITHITSVSQLNGILSKDKNKLSVIDFYATWCAPCHAIAPAFEAFSKKYSSVNFLKCDVDAATEVARLYSVSAMPTFIFLKGSSKVDQLKGADKSALESIIQKHAVSSTSTAFSGKGHTLGGNPATPDIVGEVKQTVDKVSVGLTQIDPQLQVFLGLIGLYLLFWYYG
ncbi:thioredoxin-like protein [Phlegmacium glaucopus]|nr:thioredoxin-like protein [Phlegmacium glaucopus]